MNKLTLAIIFIFCSYIVFAAKPIVEVPNLPDKAELELYEESEGLFSMQVMEYYKIAVALESQLKIFGIIPKTILKHPLFEELEDMDIKTLQKFYRIAKALEVEVLQAPESMTENLQNQISNLQLQLRDTISQMTIQNSAERNQILDKMNQKLKEINELSSENIERALNSAFADCYDYKTWFAVSPVTKIFISDGESRITNDPGLGVQLSANIGKLTGFWDGFELKYEYTSPVFYSNYNQDIITRHRDQWNTNLNSVTAGGKINVNKNTGIDHGFYLSAGYFWANSQIYNNAASSMEWDGGLLSLEYFAASPSCKFPVEIFAGFTVYHSFSRNLLFTTPVTGHENIELAKTHISANIGLRFNILRTPF